MNILEKIVDKTKLRVTELRSRISIDELKYQAFLCDKTAFRFEYSLQNNDISFICEIKKASPSKGIIDDKFAYLDIAKEYDSIGVDAISILSEPYFFLGSNDYLCDISKIVSAPLLRKDFIIDESQIYESKILGADAILLICSILDFETLKHFINIADSIGLSSLVEVHNKDEISKAIRAESRIIGVNNRDLKTFRVDITNSINLRKLVPNDVIFVSESGIKTHKQIKQLIENDVNAVLIGETFMRAKDKKRELQILKGEISEN